jgi:hypothetical protein
MLAFERYIIERDRLAFDKASARSFDADGRMHVTDCRVSKANVCPYYGREIPNAQRLGLDANKVYMLYRDPVELEKAAPSFRNVQLLMKHTAVNAHDAKLETTVGTVGNVRFDGNYLVADQLTVWTKEGIRLIETEAAAELSSSYRYVADMTPGVSPEGVAFDGRMRDIMANHVALVKAGRAGPDVYVNDESISLESPTMKRPILLAQLIASGLAVVTSDDERLALDSKLAEMTAKDGEAAEMEDDPENPGAKRKKANPGKGEPTKPGGALASDEQIEAAIVAKGYVTLADAKTLAEDAASRATSDAVASVNALHIAREAVKPLVGVVAMDSAEAVYRFALDHEKVATDGVHPSAFPALVAQVVARKSATPVAVAAPVLAADAASAVQAALPGLGRIVVGAK